MPVTSAKLLARHPALAVRAAIPLGLSFGVTLFLGEQLKDLVQAGVTAAIAAAGFDTSGWLGTLTTLLATAAAFLIGVLSFSGIATLISTPFNDFLAEAVEPHSVPKLLPAPTGSIATTIRNVFLDFGKTLLSLATLGLAFVLSFIPVMNLASPAIAALAMTFQYITYPQTRRGQGLRTSLGFFRKNTALALGFGFAHLALFAIPLVSAFILPLAVVGGTLLYARGRE